MILRVFLLWLCLATAPHLIATDTIEADLNQLYNRSTEPNGTLTIFKYQVKQSQVVRVYLHSDNSSSERPLLAVFREQRAVLSVQLPIRLEKNYLYDTVARTLCPFGNESLPASVRGGDLDLDGSLTIELNCFSVTPVAYSLKAYLLDRFELTLGEQMNLSASPSQPVYLRYRIPARLDSVLVVVESEDPICMTVSIQQIGCPVFDLDNNVIFSGIHQTMTKQAAVPVQRSTHSDFYIVFVVKPNDDICSEMVAIQPATGPVHVDERIKNFTVVIHELPTNSAYLIPMGLAVGAIMVIYVLAFVHVSWVSFHDRRRWEREGRDAVFGIDEETEALNNPGYSYGAVARDDVSVISGLNDESDLPSTSTADQLIPPDDTNQPGPDMDDSETGDGDYDTLDDARTDKSVVRSKANLRVSDLSLKPWKVREKKYHLYTWNVLTIALFYTLPVVQLVLTWQNTVRLSGDMDLCWYNFLCARPLFGIFSFNNVFSNIGYVMLGLLFLMMVKEREIRYRKTVGSVYESVHTEFGIPMHNGLLYALGISIMMEGVLSASYHVCPSSSNYQFDTSFMYIIGALGMLKIYQLRHPDINANAHVAFAILALFIFLAMCGVYFNDVPFWAIFAFCYILIMFGVSVEFYFKGQWRLNRHIFSRLRYHWQSTTCISCVIPRFKGRFLFLLIGNLLNLGFVVLGVVKMPRDFPSFLLLPFTGNLFLYLMYYIFMKLLNNEQMKMRTVLFLLMAFGCWIIAMWFFLHGVSDWSEMPAVSRVKNRDCILLDFYDNHDVWHFMSALSLFMSFSIFLSLDDGLQWVRRDKIVVF